MKKSMINHNDFQLSFFEVLEADEATYVAKFENDYQFVFNSQVAYEMIRDSIYVLTSYRSNIRQRTDEILWVLSDENQKDICSFTNCCLVCGFDPYEVRVSVLTLWRKEINRKVSILDDPNHDDYVAVSNSITNERNGYEKYRKAFYHIYPAEAAKRRKTS